MLQVRAVSLAPTMEAGSNVRNNDLFGTSRTASVGPRAVFEQFDFLGLHHFILVIDCRYYDL